MTFQKQNNELIQEIGILRSWSKNTLTTYKTALNLYSKINNKSMIDLVQEAEDEEDSNIRKNKRKIKQRFNNYQKTLLETGYTVQTIKLYLTRIKSIYKYYEIELPQLQPIKQVNKETFKDILTKDEIKKVLTNTNTKTRAITIFGATTGLRISDITKLTIQDFLEAIQDDLPFIFDENNIFESLTKLEKVKNIVPTWHILSKKTKTEHITFNTPEATRFIIQMLKERCMKENITIESNLFGFKYATILQNYTRLNERLQLGYLPNNQARFHTHGLRKFMCTSLVNNGADFLFVEFLAGHTLNPVQQSYYYANPEKLKRWYVKYMDCLTFFENINVIDINSKEKQELEYLKQENKETLNRIKELEEMINFLSCNIQQD